MYWASLTVLHFIIVIWVFATVFLSTQNIPFISVAASYCFKKQYSRGAPHTSFGDLLQGYET